MPKFKSQEDYQRWKAERMGGQTGIQEEISRRPETPEKLSKPQECESPRISQAPRAPQQPPPLFRGGHSSSGDNGLRPLGELFSDTCSLFKVRFITLICLYLLPVVSIVIGGGIFFGIGFLAITLVPLSKGVLIAALIVIGFSTGSIAMAWGMAAFTFAVTDETIGIREALGRGWRSLRSFIFVSSLFYFIVGGGFLLFLIPGVIFLTWFLFSQLIVVMEDERGIGALLKSKEYVKNKGFAVFLRAFVIWLISIGLGFIPMVGPILCVIFVPFMMIFIKLIYDDLRNLKGKIVLQPYSPGTKFKWIGAGALGYVVLPVIFFVIMGTTLTAPLLALKGRLSNPETQLKLREKIRGVPIEIEPGVDHQVGAEESSSKQKPGPPSFPEGKKPGATGEAFIVRDGTKETFVLQTGFFSDTRMANPRRASVQFQIPAEKYSNARRIEMVIDATKVGEHSVNGNVVRDAFMGRSGGPSQQEYEPSFQYVADGGQVFFPKDCCTIVITSPYTGDQDGVFAGEVNDCVVTSEGITHTLSAQFRMVGVSER